MKKLKFLMMSILDLFFTTTPTKLSTPDINDLQVIAEDVSEECLSDICVGNTKERLNSIGIVDTSSKEAEDYLSRDKIDYSDIEFESKVKSDLDAKEQKKRRRLHYKLHTTAGVVIYEGVHLRKFLAGTKVIYPFSYKCAYRFANKYQNDKVFKERYLISFEEKKININQGEVLQKS